MGESYPNAICDNGFNEYDTMVCRGFVEYRISKQRLRFLATHAVGYWSDTKNPKDKLLGEGENTPAMFIGTCARF